MKIVPLQYLRAIAALSVLLHHAGYFLQAYRGEAFFASLFGHPFAVFGVFTFFALSGALMAMQAEKLPDDPARFLTHRIIRIYPALFLAIAIRVGVAWVFDLGAEFDPLTFALAPLGNPLTVLGVEWTLVYEVSFYILVFAVICLRLSRYLGLLALAWIVLLMFVSWSGSWGQSQPTALQLPISVVCMPFALGLLVPELLKNNLISRWFLIVGGGIFALSQVDYFARFGIALASLGCALVVSWVVAFGHRVKIDSAIARKFGDWSFAIYLIHVPILTATFRVLPKDVPPVAAFILAVVLATATGCALGVVDVDLYGRLKRFFDARRGAIRVALCGAFGIAFVGSIVLSNTDILGAGSLPLELDGLAAARAEPDIDKVMAAAGYQKDTRLVGGVTVMIKEGNSLLAGGWINDLGSWFNGTNVIVVGSSVPAVLVPRDFRVEVTKIMGPRGYLVPVGFHQYIPPVSCPSGVTVFNLAISRSRKAYWMFSPIACPS